MNSLVRGLRNRNRFRCFLLFLVLLLTLGSLSTAAYAERFAEGAGQAGGERP